MKTEKVKIPITAIFIQDPKDKGYTGFFAEFPEAIAEGDTKEAVQKNLWEALNFMLKWRKEEIEEERLGFDGSKGIVETETFQLEVA